MTLAKIIDTLKMIALKHPNVNSAYEGNIYDILNAKPDNKYASVVITQQSHTTDETYDHYGFVIFYVDRLVDDLDENRVQIQSIGKSMLGNIITAFCNEFEAECDNIIYQPFTQRFTDETAGVYCTITIDIIKDAYCAERYWDESWSAPIISIKNMDMSITLTENGHYVLDYDPTTYTGIGKVDIDVELNTEPYYNDGYEDGYNQGYAEGEQVSYDKGYEQGQTDIAANARVLEVTENGTYRSKFSDPITPPLVTGVYDGGTEFYSYAELNGGVYNTKIAGSIDSRLEFWYKGDGKTTSASDVIIGSEDVENYDNHFTVQYKNFDATKLWIRIGGSTIEIGDFDETVWHHFIVSKADGLWFDGEKKGDFSPTTNTVNGQFYINGIGSDATLGRLSNGTFGMIKIDDVAIIPTADGFLNTKTGELLEILKDGVYAYTENLPLYGEGELYKTINVNVVPKINVAKEGIKFGISPFTELPEWADFDGVTDLSNMFNDCGNLKRIPAIDTSQVTDMNYTFKNCRNLEELPLLDTSKVTLMDSTFWGCEKLTNFPPIDTSSVTQIVNAFNSCYALTTLPALNMQSLNMWSFYGVFGYNELPNLINFGGFLNLKQSLTDDRNLKKLPNLTYESCINVLNGLYDFVGNGETPNSEQGQLKVHQNFLDTVGEEITIATNKGWTITA